MKSHLSFALCFLSLFSFSAEWSWLTTERVFRPTFADPREIRVGLLFDTQKKVNANIGAHIGVGTVRFQTEWIEEIQFGLEGAGFFTMRSEASRFPLETVDGLIALFCESRAGQWEGQLRYTHISAHLADGSTQPAFPYSQETISLRIAYLPLPSLHLYSGLHLLTHSTPAQSTPSWQIGGSYFLKLGSSKISPFTAMDLFWRRKNQDPSLSFQIGVALKDPEEAYRSGRVFYQYFTGSDVRGQFYLATTTNHSLGIEFNL